MCMYLHMQNLSVSRCSCTCSITVCCTGTVLRLWFHESSQNERHFIMQVVCEATQCADVSVQVAALQNLGKIMSLYYQYMETYMAPALFAVRWHLLYTHVASIHSSNFVPIFHSFPPFLTLPLSHSLSLLLLLSLSLSPPSLLPPPLSFSLPLLFSPDHS